MATPVENEKAEASTQSGHLRASATQGVCIFTITAPAVCTSTTYRRPKHAPPVVYEPLDSALLATNTEPHDIASQPKTRTRDYNPATDILYVTKDGFQHFTGYVCGRDGEPWAADIRHLALALPVADYGLWLPIALQRLASLETLSVVYPARSGTFDCHDDVPLPMDKSTSLQVLTEEERTSLTITADYLYETHGGDRPIVWSKNASEHLEMVEGSLVKNAGPQGWNPNKLPPRWDKKAGRLALLYQARVFEPHKLKSDGNQDEKAL